MGAQASIKQVSAVLFGVTLATSVRAADDARIAPVAREIRQAISMIEWFYVRHRTCPQPTLPGQLQEMQSGLGDGYSVEPHGQFVAIRGISTFGGWLYYTSSQHPDRCSLWRKLDWNAALIWRRRGNVTEWVVDPGDGSPERQLRATEDYAR